MMYAVTRGRGPIAFLIAAIVFVAAASMGVSSCETQPGRVGTATCLACHDGRSAPDQRDFLKGLHQGIACEDCHGAGYLHVRNGGRGGLFIENPGKLPFAQSYALCQKCHVKEFTGYVQSAHALAKAASCNDCHNVHAPNGMAAGTEDKDAKSFSNAGYAQLCGRCHEVEVEGHLKSRHAESNVATCGSCHTFHKASAFTRNPIDNSLCLQCHASFQLGFDTQQAVDAHTGTSHPVDPAGSGSSRCTSCHLPPLERFNQEKGPHDHTLFTIPPRASNEAIAAGISPVPPNSCSGILGCHDPNVPGSGEPYDVEDAALNAALQTYYETEIGRVP